MPEDAGECSMRRGAAAACIIVTGACVYRLAAQSLSPRRDVLLPAPKGAGPGSPPVGAPGCPPLADALLRSRGRHGDGAALVIGAGTGERVPEGEGAPVWWRNETLFGPSYRKVLLEPVPPVFRALQSGVAQLGAAANVSLVNAAVGEPPGTMLLWCLSATEEHPTAIGRVCAAKRLTLMRSTRAIWPSIAALARSGRLSPAAAAQIGEYIARETGTPVSTAGEGAAGAEGGARSQRTYPAAVTSHRVDVKTVAGVLGAAGVPHDAVRFVQVSAEGAELWVLRALPHADSAAFRPGVVLWDQSRLGAAAARSARELMAERGYRVCPDGRCSAVPAEAGARADPLDGCGSVFGVLQPE